MGDLNATFSVIYNMRSCIMILACLALATAIESDGVVPEQELMETAIIPSEDFIYNNQEETKAPASNLAAAKTGWHRWRPNIKTHFKRVSNAAKKLKQRVERAAKYAGKRAKMALNKHKNRAKKIRRVAKKIKKATKKYARKGWGRIKKLKKAHGKGWGRLKKFGKKLAKKVKGGWGRFKKKTVKSIKKKKGWGKKGWGSLKKKIAKAIKKTKKKASGWGKAMRKYNRWGELTESKFGSFKKHFERVRKKHVERVHKIRHRASRARAREERAL